MIGPVLWSIAVLAVVWAVDQALLWMEGNGWINYRRRGPSRSGAAYHGLLLESIFNPGAEAIIEIKYADQKEQAESGDPNRPRCPERLLQEQCIRPSFSDGRV